MKKIMAFSMIFILIVTTFLYSCRDDNINTPSSSFGDNTQNDTETKSDILDNLPNMNYGGYKFRVYVRDLEYFRLDFAAEEQTGDILNDAVYSRNLAVEERFNVKIEPLFYAFDWDARLDALTYIMAGEDAFDIFLAHAHVAAQYISRDVLVDWIQDLPYVNLDAKWWSQDLVKESSMFGKLFCAMGDIGYTMIGSTVCLFFNKDLFVNFDIEYPYDEVINGTWTMEKFTTLVKNGKNDLDGDGIITVDADMFGMGTNVYTYPIAMLYCGGDRVISKDADGDPVLTLYTERTVNIYNTLQDLIDSESVSFVGYSVDNNPNNVDTFKAGRALFTSPLMNGIVSYRAMEAEIGIVPVPKYDETISKYYTFVEAGANMICVPITAEDLERTSILLESLCVEGYRTITPAYYEKALKTKYSRDSESEDMLDYITDGIVYDYGYLNAEITGYLATCGSVLIQNQKTIPTFTNLYMTNERSVMQSIENLILKYK